MQAGGWSNTSLSLRDVWGSSPGPDTASPTARNRCDVSSELCCPSAGTRRRIPTPVPRFAGDGSRHPFHDSAETDPDTRSTIRRRRIPTPVPRFAGDGSRHPFHDSPETDPDTRSTIRRRRIPTLVPRFDGDGSRHPFHDSTQHRDNDEDWLIKNARPELEQTLPCSWMCLRINDEWRMFIACIRMMESE